MFVSCECCVLSGRGLCVGVIIDGKGEIYICGTEASNGPILTYLRYLVPSIPLCCYH